MKRIYTIILVWTFIYTWIGCSSPGVVSQTNVVRQIGPPQQKREQVWVKKTALLYQNLDTASPGAIEVISWTPLEVREKREGWLNVENRHKYDYLSGWIESHQVTTNPPTEAQTRQYEQELSTRRERAKPTVVQPPIPAPVSVVTLSALPAQPRRALVIGNAAYPESPLSNPINDATDLAALLRRLGFDVTLHRNADKPTMEKAIDSFTQGVPRGSAGLFFFAGHGVQIEGVNYLVPLGARFSAASDVKYHAVAADWILARMDESGMDVKLLLLDACRDNPLGRSWTRALSRGLGVMETPKGALLAYATSPGKTASDGTGRNSPFTVQLLRELGIPGRDIEVALKAVRAGVQQSTNGQQIPWVASSMTGDFHVAR